jgi:tetratricopeptide (TPR) repeat protein
MERHDNHVTRRPDFQERRENAMRPSKYLGYDHDRMGLYFMEREAFAIAETEFRRAIWLNPFDPGFQAHLAVCLFQLRRHGEAGNLAREILHVYPDREDMKDLLKLVAERIPPIHQTPPSVQSPP